MLTHLEFRSDKFPAVEGEDELVNPGVWGKRLADFMREGIRREGIETGEPIAEDWGWVVPLTNDPFGVWVDAAIMKTTRRILVFPASAQSVASTLVQRKSRTANLGFATAGGNRQSAE